MSHNFFQFIGNLTCGTEFRQSETSYFFDFIAEEIKYLDTKARGNGQ